MAAVTIRPPHRFPVGTTVTLYKGSDWASTVRPPAGTPPGSAVTTATVASDGSLSFTGLASNTGLYAYAQVGGVDLYVRVLTDKSQSGPPTTQTSAAMSTTTADVLPANGSATFRQVQNVDSTNGVTLKLGSGTVTDYQGIYLPPNSVWDGTIDGQLYIGLVRGKSVAGTPTLAVIEG